MSEPEQGGWSESDSAAFIEYGELFVPRRAEQLEVVCRAVEPLREGAVIADLACGEGLLGGALLERYPGCRVVGVDSSEAMLGAATRRHAASGRFEARPGTLDGFPAEDLPERLDAVVSSLSVHHLDDEGKRALFARVLRRLTAGGALVIADVVAPATAAARQLAAAQWDAEVRAAAAERRLPEAVEAFRRDGWNIFALEQFDPEDRPAPLAVQLSWLEAAGFVAVDVYWMFAGHAIFGGRAPAR